ncbi:hypothetical protein D3C72_2234760 [compost metagenome]
MVEHQAQAAEQALLLPLVDLCQHLLFFGADLPGEVLVGARKQGQAAFKQAPQGQALRGIENTAHGASPRAKPRSMR